MEIGIDSFVAEIADTLSNTTLPATVRIEQLLEEIKIADEVGLDSFGIGEHHRVEFLDSAPEILLAAAAAVTKRIRLTSAVTVLSAHDPVRVFQQFATIDLISKGRAEMVVGRGSSVEAFPLFGFNLNDYDALFAEKLGLLLELRESPRIEWSGRFRAPLSGQGVYPRPAQSQLPIWLGVGGTPGSFVRAGKLGLPLMVAIIGGEPERFRPLVDLYRKAGEDAGHSPESLRVGIHAVGYVSDSAQRAAEEFYPGYAETFRVIAAERGWPQLTRRHFDDLCGPTGALLIGDPDQVAKKVLRYNDVLRGISRLSFQMSVASLPLTHRIQAIKLLGSEVAPRLRGAQEV